jgi:hypothetical protein
MSKIEVNTVAPQCGTTLTLGESGDTVTLGAGASQSGFGRTGTVDWQTGSIKTATFTAANGEGYFANTSGGEFTINLPAGTAGAIVAVADYTRTFATNKLTVTPNGSEKIGGVAASIFLNVNGQALTLVYVDATEGWINVQNAEDTEEGIVPAFVTATGGTITTVCTNYKIHTFTSPGTFTVSCAGNAGGSNSVDYLVVAGGGAGGGGQGVNVGTGAGGGAGGYRESSGTASGSYTASPLGACVSALAVTAQGYPITVGGGGSISPSGICAVGGSGSNSVFSTVTSAGGGGAGSNLNAINGVSGGSGGGAAGPGGTGGSGNTPPTSPPQGNSGGASSGNYTGGGGGAGAVGACANFPANSSGNGGNGVSSSITGSSIARAGGGGGGVSGGGGCIPSYTNGLGGTGGGGNGQFNICVTSPPNLGTANTGGGGGGGGDAGSNGGAGTGGSGIVIIRYKFQ